MSWETSFEEFWNSNKGVMQAKRKLEMCAPAQDLYNLITPLCEEAIESQSLIKINQAKLIIQDAYFNYKAIAPNGHRNYMNDRPKHICIYAIYSDTIMKLRKAELQIQPPILFIPVPEPLPKPLPKPHIGGIFLEKIDDLDE